MATDFKELIQLPAWLRRPAAIPRGSHQLTLFGRALGGVFNGVLGSIYAIRRMWNVSLASGAVLDEHGADRAVHRLAWEGDDDYRARVLEGLRAKIPGETLAGMKVALDTLGLTNYQIAPLWEVDQKQGNLAPDLIAGARWSEFDVTFFDSENQTLTDGQIQRRINAAKAPGKKGNIVRIAGDGFGQRFGRNYGGDQGSSTVHPQSGFGTNFGGNFGG